MIPGATTVALLLLAVHVPPGRDATSVMPEPWHTPDGPEIVPAVGGATTVITFTAHAVPHALVNEYDIGTVPAVTPVTIPDVLPTVALELPFIHDPPDTVLESVIAAPIQTLSGPESVPASGNGLTVSIRVAVAVPQDEVTV
jgi:hypothetical protein